MIRIAVTGMVFGIGLLAASAASAHQLRQISEEPLNADTAISIDDVTVSQVVYHIASDAAPTLWITFEGEAGQQVHFETGVPVIDRLKDLRPTTMLVGPGLPQGDFPIDVPEGMGALVYPTDDIAAPEVFAEEFTGTDSWRFGPWEPTLPQTGRYYIVTFLPEGGDGKFWTAAGVAEVFGLEDIVSLPQTIIAVRGYHEIFPWGGILGWGVIAVVGALVAAFRFLFS